VKKQARLKTPAALSAPVQLLEADASAPGKVILFGEHAVVYGEPSLSLALEKRTFVSGQPVGEAFTVNGFPLDSNFHSYIERAVKLHWKEGPLRLQTESQIPSGSGIGSSAALSVATVAVLLRLQAGGPVAPETIAAAAFQTEFETQGRASPNDTTVATAGGGVLMAPKRLEQDDVEFLWRIERGEQQWNAHRVKVPSLPLVIGVTGFKGKTSEQVAKVRRFVDRSAFARDVIKDIGRITLAGIEALRKGDLRTLGDLMNRNHEHLHTLGVDTPLLETLVQTARKVPGTLGAKLTGAGGGGSMVVLTENPDDVKSALERVGAQAFLAPASPDGVRLRPP
jgi:mevalonate kinase